MAGKKKEVKIRVSGNARLARFITGPLGKVALVGFILLVTVGVEAVTSQRGVWNEGRRGSARSTTVRPLSQ